MSELVFLFSAEADIQAAYEFYEAYQVARGEVFLRHLDLAFERIRTFPELAPLFHSSYRRLLVRGFPYGIFSVIEGRRIIVSGVLDLRQDPAAIRREIVAARDFRSPAVGGRGLRCTLSALPGR